MPLPLMADGDLPSAIQRRDWAAAKTILHLSRNRLPPDAEAQWRAFLLFHSGAADAALEVYASLAAGGGDKSYELHQAACLFHLRRYPEAQALVEQGPDCALRTRLLAHCAAKAPAGGAPPAAEAQRQAAWEAELGGSRLDQLSLAALLYDRGEHEGAARVYARLLQEFPDLHALRMYLALCAYMMDDWEGAAAHVEAYQKEHPDSLAAANMRACCEFRAGGAAAALHALGTLPQQLAAGGLAPSTGVQHGALVRHNAVVFGDGQGGMQVLPPLVGVVPEARLNLALLYCRRGDAARAVRLLQGLEPATAFEHICKGVACALHGQAAGSAEHVRAAQEAFRAVGDSPTEVDSVPGRQCLASAALLGGDPQAALPLLKSIAEVCAGDDALSWNLGLARAAAGQWAGAAEALQAVQADPVLQSWLVRCLVRAGRAEEAWELCVQAQQRWGPAPSVAELLGLAAGECYREGHFLWAARAYHSLEYLQQQGLPVAWAVQPPGVAAAGGGGVWEGKRAAVVQAFRQLAEGRGKASALLPELLGMLRSSTNPQAAAVAGTMKQWAREHAPEAAAALA